LATPVGSLKLTSKNEACRLDGYETYEIFECTFVVLLPSPFSCLVSVSGHIALQWHILPSDPTLTDHPFFLTSQQVGALICWCFFVVFLTRPAFQHEIAMSDHPVWPRSVISAERTSPARISVNSRQKKEINLNEISKLYRKYIKLAFASEI
jgi:hypothetical protein